MRADIGATDTRVTVCSLGHGQDLAVDGGVTATRIY
jgi:hypothetical protein